MATVKKQHWICYLKEYIWKSPTTQFSQKGKEESSVLLLSEAVENFFQMFEWSVKLIWLMKMSKILSFTVSLSKADKLAGVFY